MRRGVSFGSLRKTGGGGGGGSLMQKPMYQDYLMFFLYPMQDDFSVYYFIYYFSSTFCFLIFISGFIPQYKNSDSVAIIPPHHSLAETVTTVDSNQGI